MQWFPLVHPPTRRTENNKRLITEPFLRFHHCTHERKHLAHEKFLAETSSNILLPSFFLFFFLFSVLVLFIFWSTENTYNLHLLRIVVHNGMYFLCFSSYELDDELKTGVKKLAIFNKYTMEKRVFNLLGYYTSYIVYVC